MDEARKTNMVRDAGFIRAFLSKRVIDIGCGADLVVAHAEPFDLQHGDAQFILNHHPAESFDTVHSSHCLEHMRDVEPALLGWWSLVRPGGHMIIVVPEENLYEQGAWPSLFNKDHKATFRLNRPTRWSRHSYDLGALAAALPDADVISAEIQDAGYNRQMMHRRITGWGRLLHRLAKRRGKLFYRLSRLGLSLVSLDHAMNRLEQRAGKPIDQTRGDALAQIQVIVRKQPHLPGRTPLPPGKG